MITCIIIDDERPAINVIERYIEKLPDFQLIGTTTNPIHGIQLIKQHEPDVVFLDIQMDEMNGIEVMKAIGGITKVVFCTAYSEFAVESYELKAFDYLMKPIEYPRFSITAQRLTDTFGARSASAVTAIPNDYIFVKAGKRGKMIRVDFNDIDYIQGMSNYVAFVGPPRKIVAYLSLKELEERLPSSDFMRVHKSFIVALRQVASLENNELILKKAEMHVPVGANYKELFLERMRDKLMH